jgi:hypothetical protein
MYDGVVFHERPAGGGARYRGHVNRDGTVTLEIDERGFQKTEPWELSALEESLRHLHLAARRRRLTLSGADRHVFVLQHGIYRVRYQNDEQLLVSFKARATWRCMSCSGSIQVGAEAYRTSGPARGDRYCAICVKAAETVPDAGTPPKLRVIAGGRT